MVQRVVNYVLPENGLIRTPDSAFKTRNFLLRLSPSLEIESSAEILPPADLPTLAYDRVQGFEDLRPFAWRGALWCSSATRELNPEGWHQQVLARLDEGADRQCRLADWRILALEGPRRYEKNWMPFVEPAAAEGGEERLRFIYLCDPTRLVEEFHRPDARVGGTPVRSQANSARPGAPVIVASRENLKLHRHVQSKH